MIFRITNDSPEPMRVGLEPWGYYISLETKEQVEIEVEILEDITYDVGLVVIWCNWNPETIEGRAAGKMTKNGVVICNY